jgi:hypothetical protein
MEEHSQTDFFLKYKDENVFNDKNSLIECFNHFDVKK